MPMDHVEKHSIKLDIIIIVSKFKTYDVVFTTHMTSDDISKTYDVTRHTLNHCSVISK